MVKHTQAVRWQEPTNYFSVFDHFIGLALKEYSQGKSTQMLTKIMNIGINIWVVSTSNQLFVRGS